MGILLKIDPNFLVLDPTQSRDLWVRLGQPNSMYKCCPTAWLKGIGLYLVFHKMTRNATKRNTATSPVKARTLYMYITNFQ